MAASKFKASFAAEIKQVSSKKTASLDLVYRVVLETDDGSVMNLGTLAPDQLFDVSVEGQG